MSASTSEALAGSRRDRTAALSCKPQAAAVRARKHTGSNRRLTALRVSSACGASASRPCACMHACTHSRPPQARPQAAACGGNTCHADCHARHERAHTTRACMHARMHTRVHAARRGALTCRLMYDSTPSAARDGMSLRASVPRSVGEEWWLASTPASLAARPPPGDGRGRGRGGGGLLGVCVVVAGSVVWLQGVRARACSHAPKHRLATRAKRRCTAGRPAAMPYHAAEAGRGGVCAADARTACNL